MRRNETTADSFELCMCSLNVRKSGGGRKREREARASERGGESERESETRQASSLSADS
jgi:hypothetical protein